MKDPAGIIASHLASHLKKLRKLERQLEAFAPTLREVIKKTQSMMMAFENIAESETAEEAASAT